MVVPVTRSRERPRGLGNVIALLPPSPPLPPSRRTAPYARFVSLSFTLPTSPLFIARTRPVHNINMLHLWPHLLHRVHEFLRCRMKKEHCRNCWIGAFGNKLARSPRGIMYLFTTSEIMNFKISSLMKWLFGNFAKKRNRVFLMCKV